MGMASLTQAVAFGQSLGWKTEMVISVGGLENLTRELRFPLFDFHKWK